MWGIVLIILLGAILFVFTTRHTVVAFLLFGTVLWVIACELQLLPWF